VGKNEAGDTAQPEWFHDGVGEDDEGDEDGLVGNEHAEEDQWKDDVGAFELPLGKDITVERAEEGGKNGSGDNHFEAVYQVGS